MGASRRVATAAVVAVLLGGCTGTPTDVPTSTVTPAPTETRTAAPGPPSPTGDAGPYQAGPGAPPANASPMDVATGLAAPWDLAFLPSGAVLVSLRDEAGLVVLTAAGPSDVGGEGADQLAADAFVEGEAGLLGVEVSPTFEQDSLVYLYRTTPDGNEVVRARLAPDLTLGPLEPLVVSVLHTWFHDGGRLAFGPDGFLYIATGDAGDRPLSQDQGSLAGKILRVTADGTPAPGNPVDGNPMWSYGHRNVQGLGWSEDGAMFASEFGANTWDELNVIAPGANYGWPAVEGVGGRAGFVDPVVTWRTQDASPSGIAVTADAVYVAALRGERLWKVPLVPGSPGEVGEPEVALDGLGRLRHVELGPDGALWVVTNNTDGRGSPRDGDDRIVRLTPP